MQENPPREALLLEVMEESPSEGIGTGSLRPPVEPERDDLADRLRRWLESIDR